jgi:hypothetical protein
LVGRRARRSSSSTRAALFLQPELWFAAFYLALCYEQGGRLTEARRELARVVASAERATTGCVLFDELERWKPEVLALARRHLLRKRSTE